MAFQHLLVLILLVAGTTASNTFTVCPVVEPVQDFDIHKFLGKWYDIEPTLLNSTCVTYNFNRDDGHVIEVMRSNKHFLEGCQTVESEYPCTGILETPDTTLPGQMNLTNLSCNDGSTSYTVFETDYENYGAMFSCQKMGQDYKKSLLILSRTPNIDGMYVAKILDKLRMYGIVTGDLDDRHSFGSQSKKSKRGLREFISKTFSGCKSSDVLRVFLEISEQRERYNNNYSPLEQSAPGEMDRVKDSLKGCKFVDFLKILKWIYGLVKKVFALYSMGK